MTRFKTLLLLATLLIGNKALSQNELSQFDFWIGHWNVYKFDTDTIVGISSIQPKLNHNAIEENYQSLKHTYQGKSLNTFDKKRKRWEQFYVDNSGLKLHLVGNFQNNKMILTDCSNINQNCNKIAWTSLNDGTVRQVWQQSKDGGKTWKKVFDGHYRKRE